MTQLKTYTLAEQRKILEAGWPHVQYRLIAKLGRDSRHLFDMARERFITVGADQYGDKSFHLSRKQVDYEIECELADALFYEAIYHWKDTNR